MLLSDFGQVLVESQDSVISDFVILYLDKELGVSYVPGSVYFWMPDSKEDTQYEIIWSKRGGGWKYIDIIYKETTDGPDIPVRYTFKQENIDIFWPLVVTNLHAQGYQLSVWGF